MTRKVCRFSGTPSLPSNPARCQALRRAWITSPTPATQPWAPSAPSATPCSSTRPSPTSSARSAAADAGGVLVRADQQQRLPPGDGVAEPGAGGVGLGLLGGAGVEEPAVLGVLVERAAVAVAQPQRRRALPLGGEAADLGELVADPALGQIRQRAARSDGGQLARVADQQQLGARGLAALVDLAQLGGAGHPGLVDHHQVPRPQPQRVVAEPVRARPGGRCRGGAGRRATGGCSRW